MLADAFGAVVGEGVSSHVYAYGDSCVVKVSKPDMQDALKVEARLHNIIQKYDNTRNYVPMLDHGELTPDTYWLKFPRLHALPKQLTQDQTLVVAYRICTALASLHRHRFCHCDIKSANIMYNGKDLNSCSLIDFGLMQAHIYTTEIQSGSYRPNDVKALTSTCVPWRQACASDCFALGRTLHQFVTKKAVQHSCNVHLNHIITGLLNNDWKQRLTCEQAIAYMHTHNCPGTRTMQTLDINTWITSGNTNIVMHGD